MTPQMRLPPGATLEQPGQMALPPGATLEQPPSYLGTTGELPLPAGELPQTPEAQEVMRRSAESNIPVYQTPLGLPPTPPPSAPAPAKPLSPSEQFVHEAFVNPAKQLASGFDLSMGASNQLAANIAGLLGDTWDSFAAMYGIPKARLMNDIKDFYTKKAQEWNTSAGGLAGGRQDLMSSIYRGVGSLPVSLPTAAVATTAGGPVVGLGTLGALENLHRGPGAALEAAVENAALGGTMHVLGPGNRIIRLTGNMITAYTDAMAHGADKTQALSQALTMGAMGAAGPSEGAGFGDIARNARAFQPTDLIPQGEINVGGWFRNPNEAARQAYGYMREQVGVPPSAAAATGSPFVRRSQQMLESSPLGAVFTSEMPAQTTEALRSHAQQLLDDFTPETPPGQLYKEFREFHNDPSSARPVPTGEVNELGKPVMEDMQMPVDMRPLVPALREVYDQMSYWSGKRKNDSAAWSAVNKILNQRKDITAQQAEYVLGALKETARDGKGMDAGVSNYLIPRLQSMIDDSVYETGGPDAVEALQKGRVAAAQQAGVDWLGKELNKAMAAGGFDQNQSLWGDWRRLPDEYKRTMYTPEQVKQLNNFFLGQRNLAEQANPSQTALTLHSVSALGAFLKGHPISATATILGEGYLAKLLRSDAGVKLLTEGLKVRVGSPQAKFIQQRLEKLAGPPEEPPPSSTTPPTPPSTPPGSPPPINPTEAGGGPETAAPGATLTGELPRQGPGEQIPASEKALTPAGILYRSDANGPRIGAPGYWATPSLEYARGVGGGGGSIERLPLPPKENTLNLGKAQGYTPDEAVAAITRAFPKATPAEIKSLIDRDLWVEDDRQHYDIPDLIHTTNEDEAGLLASLLQRHGYDAVRFQEPLQGSDMAHEGSVQKGRVPSYFIRSSEPTAQQPPAAPTTPGGSPGEPGPAGTPTSALRSAFERAKQKTRK